MIRTKLAMKVLKKREQMHLTEMGINSMAQMQSQVENMKRLNPEFPARCCFECASIARKLGLAI